MKNLWQRIRNCFSPAKGYDPDDILNLHQVVDRLFLDRRTVRRIAFKLGGRRFRNRWRFRWGSVLEYFNNAYIETGQRKLLDGAGIYGWQADCQQDVPARQERRPGMEGRETMGGRSAKNYQRTDCDPYGLGKAYTVGKRVSEPCEAHHEPTNAC